ncbi:hypothetical protein F0562_000876 [Nyssa sinensis]|uniref:Uncharacterized protein n=1 Tax=Nyssa sinensis TaxID=561372 RepID=A0A5J5C5J5_9ASTE|nr:hypothetical protein F0562_000876 [Nyssa sinensis]
MVERTKPLVLSSTKALVNDVLCSSRTQEREERTKPLALSSTKALVNSVLCSSRTQERDGIGRNSDLVGDDKSPNLLLSAGNLLLSKERTDISHPKVASLDDSALVGLPTTVLKNLSMTSGSPVPNVKWEDIVGLEDVKKSILDTVQDDLQMILLSKCNPHDICYLSCTRICFHLGCASTLVFFFMVVQGQGNCCNRVLPEFSQQLKGLN